MYQTYPIFRYPVSNRQYPQDDCSTLVTARGRYREYTRRPYLPVYPRYGHMALDIAHLELYGPIYSPI